MNGPLHGKPHGPKVLIFGLLHVMQLVQHCSLPQSRPHPHLSATLPSHPLLLYGLHPVFSNFQQKLLIKPSTMRLKILLNTPLSVISNRYVIAVAGRHLPILEVIGTLVYVVIVKQLVRVCP